MADRASDVGFKAVGPDKVVMGTTGQHFKDSGTTTGRFRASDPNSSNGPSDGISATADSEAGTPDDSTDSQGPSNDHHKLDYAAFMDAGRSGRMNEWIKDNGIGPCPATVAITVFALTETGNHFIDSAEMALAAGNIPAYLKAMSIAEAIGDSLEVLKGKVDLTTMPALDFDILHKMMSVTDAGWVCEVQAMVNENNGFDTAGAIETVSRLVFDQPGPETLFPDQEGEDVDIS